MMTGVTVALVSLAYILALFAIAWSADRRAAEGRILSGPTVYALSLAVFCTTWTFYGSVGRAASQGIGFLPTYLGPTLMMVLGYGVIAKILRIARQQRSTSIADFIASRYGRSQTLGGAVALVAVVGITPYIALQLKAVSVGFEVLTGGGGAQAPGILADTGLWVALAMAVFAIMFGTRSIDASEHHPGLVAAVAFESIVKLATFLAVGVAVVWGLHGGPGDLFAAAMARPDVARLFTSEAALGGGTWVTVLLLSMAAMVCLPRQFQVLVVENTDERHLHRALWLFPAYMLAINLFVLPIAVAGLIHFPPGTADPDMIVLALPLSVGWEPLALAAFIGGLSAATGMIIVETVALATMVSNDLVLPLLLRFRHRALDRMGDLGRLMLTIRRLAIVTVLVLGYVYFRLAGGAYALVSIGLISFAAVAQFAPALFGGLFWAGGTRRGAIAGLTAGTVAWTYTLLIPSFARSGWMDPAFLTDGPGGIWWLAPHALFGLDGLDPLAHSLFWSMAANIGLYVAVSLWDSQSVGERTQATAYVEVFQQAETWGQWRGRATIGDLHRVVARFLGPERTDQAFARFRDRRTALDDTHPADAETIRRVERLLAGAIGAASARVALASAMGSADVGLNELARMLDETSQVIEYSRRLERKSAELEQASAALSAANLQLRELDRMKDDFLSTVTHELRTPLTAVRALSEILHDNPEMDVAQRQEFLATVIKESERLTRLINQVLDMAKIEAGEMDWHVGPIDLADVVRDATAATSQLFRDRGVALSIRVPDAPVSVMGDPDRLTQVLVNLLSNAVKFAPAGTGTVALSTMRRDTLVEVSVTDNGPGIAPANRDAVFDKFRQVGDQRSGKPQGTGLGLSICRSLVERMGGRIWIADAPGGGADVRFTIPVAGTD